VERHVVVEFFARELLDPFGMLGRKVGPQLDDDPPILGIDENRVLRIESLGQRGLRRLRRSRSAVAACVRATGGGAAAAAAKAGVTQASTASAARRRI
jgi:hypothetical protein